MFVGVKKVVCTCGIEMRRTGGVFGSNTMSDTYFCDDCQKHIIVLTPRREEQLEFVERLKEKERRNDS